ncbi:thioesterase family protein [Thalassospira lucentensis]|uniref:thioesterase family protein n=1 Tax=Thalassospira lucentensis TaxID=168935 RepID=UPI003AA93F90
MDTETGLEALPPETEVHGGFPVTARHQVPSAWTDYNGHMNEAHYVEIGSWATDGLMGLVGADEAYIAGGLSYFTVETHVRYLDEVLQDDTLTVSTQVLEGAAKKMHLFHRLWRSDGTLSATVETFLLHIDLKSRRSCPATPLVEGKLVAMAQAHADQEAEGAGRFVGQRATVKTS